MKKSIIKKAIALFMSVLMFSLASFTVLAEGNKEYISELCVASNSDAAAAKKELTDKGYTVIDNNVNDGTGKDATYIGYKTTTNGADAITDMRVMDMNGGYSVSDYENSLKKYEEQVTAELEKYKSSIDEFRELYLDNDKKAVFAYNQLNKLKEDDSGKLIGDLFIEENLDISTLTKVFVQGNIKAINAIQQYFALVFSESWLSDAAEFAKAKYTNSALDDYCKVIIDKWDELQGGLCKYAEQLKDENGYDIDKYTEESYNEWAKDATDNQKFTVSYYGGIYSMLKKYDIGNSKTLADLFMTEKANVTYDDIYPIAGALSEGSINSIEYVGLSYIVLLSDLDFDKAEEYMETNKEEINQTIVEQVNKQAKTEDEKITEYDETMVESVYTGVDRSLFDKNGGVALTTDALRSQASSSDKTVGQIFGEKMLIYGIVATVISGLVISAGAVFIVFYNELVADAVFSDLAAVLYRPKLIAGVALICVGIGLLIGTIGYLVYKSYKEYYHPDYKTIPRAIVDENVVKKYDKDGKLTSSEKNYIAYYAVFDAEDTGSGNRKYGDLNSWAGKQWNALYTTKDRKAGNPITADFLVQTNTNTPEGYSPLRYFGSNNSAFNLNSHAFSSKNDIYLFYRAETEATTVGSSFSAGYIAIAGVAGLIVGGAVCFAIAKKKYSKKEVA